MDFPEVAAVEQEGKSKRGTDRRRERNGKEEIQRNVKAKFQTKG